MSARLNRRSFLHGSAALGVLGLNAARTQGQSAAKAPMPPARRGPNEEIRTAILGIRGQGRHHIKYHQACRNIRIVTLCDPDERLFADRVKLVTNEKVKTETDLRRVFDDPDVDCVSIAMPNHWHALATVWACQAGKDVYVEKPATYCVAEGRRMIEVARQTERVVQVGTHLRSKQGCQDAMKTLRSGVIGDVHTAEAFVRRKRESIGYKDNGPVPAGVHYDLWCGPAPKPAFNPNRFHYNWHWYWDYGNGETGNNGPHLADLAIQGLDKQRTLPVHIASHGGRLVWDDQGETPNVQTTEYRYDDGKTIRLDVRNLPTVADAGAVSGVIFYGDKGRLTLHLNGRYETVVDGEPGPSGSGGGAHTEHVANFYEVVRSRKLSGLLAPIESGHTGAALCHLANTAYRLGRPLRFDPSSERFVDDAKADAWLDRDYRAPYTMPDQHS